MLWNKKTRLDMYILLMSVVLVGGTDTALAIDAPEGWVITQLSENSYDDSSARISGSNVTWHGDPAAVLLYDGTATIQLSNNATGKSAISGSNAVWSGFDGSDYEVFLYNIDTGVTTQLTDNSWSDVSPQISGSHVVWVHCDSVGCEVFLHNIDTVVTTQLTYDATGKQWPRNSGSNVVWTNRICSEGTCLVAEFFYDGDTQSIIQLSDYHPEGPYGFGDPQISGSNVVWRSWDGNDYEIFLYDGSTGTTIQLTNNTEMDTVPQISGSSVVWCNMEIGPGAVTTILLYDGATTIPLTDEGDDPWGPQISGSNVVWLNWDGNDGDIFLYDGTTTMPLTNDDFDAWRPCISGSNVAWEQEDGMDWEIYLASPVSPDPADLIGQLVDQVESLNLQHGIDNSLDAKLGSALGALDDINENNDVAAINSLQAFINAVEAQSGSHIPEEDADALIAAAQEIIDLLSG